MGSGPSSGPCKTCGGGLVCPGGSPPTLVRGGVALSGGCPGGCVGGCPESTPP